MADDDTKVILKRYLEDFWNAGNLETADQIIDGDYTDHRPVGETKGLAALKQYAAAFRGAFPDLRFTAEDEIIGAGKGVVRWTMTGTHQGELMGMAATGKRVTLAGTTIFHIRASKIVETWVFWDRANLMGQLGK